MVHRAAYELEIKPVQTRVRNQDFFIFNIRLFNTKSKFVQKRP